MLNKIGSAVTSVDTINSEDMKMGQTGIVMSRGVHGSDTVVGAWVIMSERGHLTLLSGVNSWEPGHILENSYQVQLKNFDICLSK